MTRPATPLPVTTPGRRRTGPVLAVTALGTLLGMIAFTAPLSIVPAVAHHLDAGTVGTAWILSSMSLGLAVALLTSGAIGDTLGRRRVFVVGAVLLAAGSMACAVAPTAAAFVLGRIIEGLGAAAVIACGLGITSHTFPPGPARTRATGIWGAGMGAGPGVGPLLGSAAEATVGWRYAYLVLTVLAVLLATAAWFVLPETRSSPTRRIDVVGALLLGAGLGCLLSALTEGRQGWTSPLDIGLIAATVVFLVVFVVRQLRTAEPMLDLALFRHPALVSATLAAFATGAGIIALVSFFSTVLQRGMATSAVGSAVITLAWAAVSVATSLLVRWLPEAVSGAARLVAGLAGITVGLVPLGLLGTTGPLWQILTGLVVAGIGTGILNATLGREAVASVPPALAGTGSGINNASRYIGAAFGVTVVTVVATPPAGADQAAGTVAGWNTAVLLGIALCVASAIGVVALRRVDAARSDPPAPGGESRSRAVTPSPLAGP
jgi:MFS family permease